MRSDADRLKFLKRDLEGTNRALANEKSEVLREIFESQAKRIENEIKEVQLTSKLPSIQEDKLPKKKLPKKK